MEPEPLPGPDLTELANQGRRREMSAAIEANYAALRELARRLMRRETPGISLHPTALIHEAVVLLLRRSALTPDGEVAFLAMFAGVCRRLLVDRARRRRAAKRGGGKPRQVLTGSGSALGVPGDVGVVEIDDLLVRLRTIDPRLEQIVELRVFAGMSEPQCARELGVSVRTIAGDWKLARDWLRRELARDA